MTTDDVSDTPDLMDTVHVSSNTGEPESVLLHLPEFTYLDTQVWSMDVGIPRTHLPAVIAALTAAQVVDGEEA